GRRPGRTDPLAAVGWITQRCGRAPLPREHSTFDPTRVIDSSFVYHGWGKRPCESTPKCRGMYSTGEGAMNTANFLSIPASLFPDQEIIVFEGTRLTYGQVLERVRRLASGLRELEIGRGDRVAMLQTNSHQFIETYYATATLGATFVPLNYRAKLPELEYMVT